MFIFKYSLNIYKKKYLHMNDGKYNNVRATIIFIFSCFVVVNFRVVLIRRYFPIFSFLLFTAVKKLRGKIKEKFKCLNSVIYISKRKTSRFIYFDRSQKIDTEIKYGYRLQTCSIKF